jgi:hypothetical protein
MSFSRTISPAQLRQLKPFGLLLAAAAQATAPLLPPVVMICPTVKVTESKWTCSRSASQTSVYAVNPGASVQLLGANFGSGTPLIEIYFDNTQLDLAVAEYGIFVITVQIPATAQAGQHWITAVDSGFGAQFPIQVQDNWSSFRYGIANKGQNYYEDILNQSNVGNIDVAWSYQTGSVVQGAAAQLDT